MIAAAYPVICIGDWVSDGEVLKRAEACGALDQILYAIDDFLSAQGVQEWACREFVFPEDSNSWKKMATPRRRRRRLAPRVPEPAPDVIPDAENFAAVAADPMDQGESDARLYRIAQTHKALRLFEQEIGGTPSAEEFAAWAENRTTGPSPDAAYQ